MINYIGEIIAAILTIITAGLAMFYRGHSVGVKKQKEEQLHNDYENIKQTIKQNNTVDGNPDVERMSSRLSNRLRRK